MLQISIIICTCNRARHLLETVQSLDQVHVPHDMAVELIVVDNASTDETDDVVKGLSLANMTVRYHHEPRIGKGNAYNTGIAVAAGEILLWTDDDIRFPRDWIARMSDPILSGKADAVAGGVRIAPHLERLWMQPMHKAWLAATGMLNTAAPYGLVGANMAFSRRVLACVPFFDPELGAGALGTHEETLFSDQLRIAGCRIMPVFDCCVDHHFLETRLLRQSFVQAAEKFGRSSAYVMYHWEHENILFPKLHLARKRLQIALWRAWHYKDYRQMEGMHIDEMHHLRSFYLYQQYQIERSRVRKYVKHGLIKSA